MLSSRLASISESKTVSSSNKAAKMKAQGIKVFNFGIGEPDFTTPEHIIKAGFDAAIKGKTHYTPSAGIPELREAIARKMKKINSVDCGPENVLVTPTKFSINLAFLSILNEGDQVLIPEPYFLSYPEIVKLTGGRPLPVRTDNDYDFDFDLMRKKVSGKTRAIILSNPCNPTGKVYSRKQMKMLEDFVLENNLYLISDEIYEDLIFDGSMYSPASNSELADKVVTIGGFSKSYAMTGWRIGYMVGPEPLIRASNKLQQQTITCVSSIAQYAALAAIEDREAPEKFRKVFLERRNLVDSLISRSETLTMRKVEGAFYAFVKYNKDIPSEEYCNRLLDEKKVLVTPGSAFGDQGEGHFRLSFATDNDTIKNGIELIDQFNREL
ncbi:MAG: pyridoxal phosphate-dependent aminotransferase [Thermoplasmataceae archaeon]|jgi:aspartate aminotransferase